MAEIWSLILKQVVSYGPFPFGIIVGIWINRWSTSAVIKMAGEEKAAIREEKKELHGIITAKEARIDALHDRLLPK